MQLGVHEACELNELLMSCTNSINTMAMFLNQVKDPELKSMIQKQMAAHVQDYNMKCEWITKGSSQQKLAVPAMPTQGFPTQPPQPQSTMPNPTLTQLDDRAMATSYLLTLKRSGRDYAWASFETWDPQLRSFLADAYVMCTRHSLEVAQWLAKRGYYPTEQAPNTLTQKISQTYQPVKEMAAIH